jgi:hypothetical protein
MDQTFRRLIVLGCCSGSRSRVEHRRVLQAESRSHCATLRRLRHATEISAAAHFLVSFLHESVGYWQQRLDRIRGGRTFLSTRPRRFCTWKKCERAITSATSRICESSRPTTRAGGLRAAWMLFCRRWSLRNESSRSILWQDEPIAAAFKSAGAARGMQTRMLFYTNQPTKLEILCTFTSFLFCSVSSLELLSFLFRSFCCSSLQSRMKRRRGDDSVSWTAFRKRRTSSV